MWDTAVEIASHVTHDAPCVRCAHATHTYLPCSDSCDCGPPAGFLLADGRVFATT